MCAFRLRFGMLASLNLCGLIAIVGLAHTVRADQIIQDYVTIQTVTEPRLRLEQTNVGFTPYKWDLEGDENSFRILDTADGMNVLNPLNIAAGAPDGSLIIGTTFVRAGTSLEAPSLQVRDSNPVIRLVSLDGFTPVQSWGLVASPFGCGIGDETAQTFPFVVETETPSDTLYLSREGHVGIGTFQPERIGSVATGGNARHLNLDAGTGQARHVVQGQLGAELFMVHKGGAVNRKIVRFGVSGGKYRIACLTDNLQGNTESSAFCIDMTTTHVGIKTAIPTFPLQVGDAGTNDGNGAHVTPGGVWTNASSRAVKQDIEPITLEQARDTVRALQPVGYRYKNEPEEEYVGFIAEDVPELVATNDRKSLAPMDLVAVLAKVVQDQDRVLEAQRETITALQQTVARQEQWRAQWTQRLADIERKLGDNRDSVK